MLQQSVVTENGERVIPGSRRPDGTIRKERRVRAGYVPQDEQPVYQSVGALFKQGVPKCPGLDEKDMAAAKEAAKSKAQKKNEKRKAKRTTGVEETTQGLQALSVSSQSQSPRPQAQQPAAAAAGGTTDESCDPKAQVEKQIRNLKKKIRQCDSLLERLKADVPLNAPEKEKLSRLAGWQQEVANLEQQFAAL